VGLVEIGDRDVDCGVYLGSYLALQPFMNLDLLNNNRPAIRGCHQSTIIMFLDIIHRLVFCLKCPVYTRKQNVSETGFYYIIIIIIIIIIIY
jgi:hypothetical protein